MRSVPAAILRSVRALALWLALAAAPERLPALPAAESQGRIAPKPLYRDPVFDGAADPVVVWNRAEHRWFMFYTNRRANVAGLDGVSWVHGTPIGIAESLDGGASWKYRTDARIHFGGKDFTFWAPEVVAADGVYHLFVAVVPGIFRDWNAPRFIIHLTSADLLDWTYRSTLKLSSDRVIDPCVFRLADGSWRMWYNDERAGKREAYADSPDLNTWTDRGLVPGIGHPGEGPYVFSWKGHGWMLVDLWRGLGVYRTDDYVHWTPQSDRLLETPGHGTDDAVRGGHPGVVVSGGRAYCFYFTHPGRASVEQGAPGESYEQRRSSIQVVELEYRGGRITCDRDRATRINLVPPDAR